MQTYFSSLELLSIVFGDFRLGLALEISFHLQNGLLLVVHALSSGWK